ncbi:substrate-binding domain-containing protein [Desulfobacula toluolica]|uniref:ABC transporter, periplasmic substrate-binding protein n=1 Tax=Desulfobacula toluolica (strain DSM 7467 / Tol2) TaxID=651182 RepID=K0NG03_DESTT|nr:substrate-binding domain-containing protein [Desulfobacula toluolica]CCK78708.1 ABC transporter, periplasmic substrate-binding protein [Desulfobacula toluolica Tol2]
MKISKKIKLGFLLILFVLILAGICQADTCKATYGNGILSVKLATGSPGELGLLKELAEVFNREHNTSMCWIKAGSGKSLELLKNKKVDIAMVHAPAAEKQAVKDGWAIKRVLIGSNEFYIVGPKSDPAGIAYAKSAADAYARIAKSQSNFLSRGDNSGTNKKELAIWKKACIDPEGDWYEGNWYIITKTFMMATLKKADQINGYFMTDSSTWVAGKKDIKNLKVLFKGDPVLINTYHGLCQPVGNGKSQEFASKFIDFIASKQGQKIVGEYGKGLYGEAMYNDAEYAKQYNH